jgi:hypothetical protein
MVIFSWARVQQMSGVSIWSVDLIDPEILLPLGCAQEILISLVSTHYTAFVEFRLSQPRVRVRSSMSPVAHCHASIGSEIFLINTWAQILKMLNLGVLAVRYLGEEYGILTLGIEVLLVARVL